MATKAATRQMSGRSCTIAADGSSQNWRSYLRLALGALALTLASASAAQHKVYSTGYEISQTGLWPSLYWIDNDRLLFAGIETADMEAAIVRKDEERRHLKKLYLWDARTKSVKHYADATEVCVADGVVHYRVRVDWEAGKIVERVGPLGSEKEIERPSGSKEELSRTAQIKWVRSQHTCKTHVLSELVPPPAKGHRILVLREGDGYLDVGPLAPKERLDQRGKPVLLFRPGRQSAVELPMKIEQGSGNPHYSPYLGAYVSRPRPKGSDPGHITSWPRGLPFTIYTFKSDGDSREAVIPYGEWGTITQVWPTPLGWIFSGHGAVRAKAGLFLFHTSSARRLDNGQVYEISVSKDGCRVAVGIQNRHLDMGTPINLKIIDLCPGTR